MTQTQEQTTTTSIPTTSVDPSAPPPDAGEQKPEAQRAADDLALYEKITGEKVEDGAAEAPEPASDPGPAPEPVDAAEEPASEPEEEPAAAPESSVPDADVEKARSFLKLKANASDEVLNNLPPEELVEWRARLQEREANVSRTYSEVSELRKEIEELRASREAAGESEQKGLPADDLDFSEQAKLITDHLGGDEETAKAFEAALKAVSQPLLTRLQEAEARLDTQQQVTVESKVDAARAALGERFPGLADNDTWKRVHATAEGLARLDRYRELGNADDAFARVIEDAARIEKVAEADPGADEVAKREAKKAETRQRKNDAQDLPGKKPSPRELTDEDRQRMYYEELQRHPNKTSQERIALAKRAAGYTH